VDVVVADMLDMPFESESFDLVIEKGTMVRLLTLIFFTIIFF
jgi:ubiquinone/menaquinone biosynthesis C-methylase UbiE